MVLAADCRIAHASYIRRAVRLAGYHVNAACLWHAWRKPATDASLCRVAAVPSRGERVNRRSLGQTAVCTRHFYDVFEGSFSVLSHQGSATPQFTRQTYSVVPLS